MARKKKRKSGWFRILILFLIVPLAVWCMAFVIWIYWYDLSAWLKRDPGNRNQPSASERRERVEKPDRAEVKRPQERILEDDRKRLDELLKRRN